MFIIIKLLMMLIDIKYKNYLKKKAAKPEEDDKTSPA